VWDYPRPPACVSTDERIRVLHQGRVVADSTAAWRVLETSHPPTFYVPRDDVDTSLLVPSRGTSLCEWKGRATYWSLEIDGCLTTDVAWSYEAPTQRFAAIAGHLAFYAQLLDECWVGDERVVPSPGMFYGGWITSRVVGPFKGAAGTLHW
jgi:uncharacterized protein (DUF427 family)